MEAETGYKVTLKPAADPLPGQYTGVNRAAPGKTAFKNDEEAFKNARSSLDAQGGLPGENALVEALSGLFEKSLAEAAAEELKKENADNED